MNTTVLQSVGWCALIAGLCVVIFATARNSKTPEREGESRMKPSATETEIAEIRRTIEELDIKYQLAVKNNDVETMDDILADDFVLITGRGKAYTKSALLDDARRRTTTYEHQEDSDRTVRVWGDTAVITALLWEKGSTNGKTFDKKLWFSDVYKLTPSGWKYVFAQSSIPQ